MHLARRSLLFFLTGAPALAVLLVPAIEAQSEPLALICEAAQHEPLQLRIDYEQESVNRYPAKFTHGQISWQVVIRGGATTDFKYDRNSGLLTQMITPPSPKAHAPSAPVAADRPAAATAADRPAMAPAADRPAGASANNGPAVAALSGPSYSCRRAD